MKRILTNKKEGTSISFVFILIAVLAVCVMIIFNTDMTTNTNRFQNVNQLAREYMLKMESAGCLTAASKSELKSELEDLGYISNVSVTAPEVEAGYGEAISLSIEYDIKLEKISFSDLINFSQGSKTEHKVKTLTSTSKH